MAFGVAGWTPAQFMKFLRSTSHFPRVVGKLNIISAENGNCLAEMKVEEEHTNFMGGLHGGVSATIVDMVTNYALLADPKNPGLNVSVEMNLSYLAKAKVGDEIQIESKTLKTGKSLVFMEVDIRNKQSGAKLVRGDKMAYGGISPVNFVKFLQTTKTFARVVDKLKIVSVGDGNCLAEMKVEEEHTNPMGGLHGGFSATLVDMVSTYSLLARPNNPAWHVSVDMHLSYIRGATVGDEIQIESKTVKAGKSLVFMEVDIRNKESGETLVKGSHTAYFMKQT